MTITGVSASTCGIERAILSGTELTILFQRDVNDFYRIYLDKMAEKSLAETQNTWQPFGVGSDGIVLYEKNKDIKKLPYLRVPLNQVLLLTYPHVDCTASVTLGAQKLRVKYRKGGWMPGSPEISSVQEIPIEKPSR